MLILVNNTGFLLLRIEESAGIARQSCPRNWMKNACSFLERRKHKNEVNDLLASLVPISKPTPVVGIGEKEC